MTNDSPAAARTPPPTGPQSRWSLLALAAAGAAVCWAAVEWSGGGPGLRPGGTEPPHVAREAEEYLRAKQVVPLSGDLRGVLTDPVRRWVPTEPHPLLNQPAPPFALTAADDAHVELDALLSRGPVVVVFYYGYSCDHCVAQLFGLNKDLRYLTELGATAVAISPDASELTRERYAEYGRFEFPVLCDRDRAIAARYGVFRPAAGDLPKWQAHGTFVVGRDRRVRWANTGPEPFTDTGTVLREVAAAQGRLPEGGQP